MENRDQKVYNIKNSSLGKLNIFFTLLIVFMTIFIVTNNFTGLLKNQGLKSILGLLLIIFNLVIFITSIIDILKKDRKKFFSIVSLSISSIILCLLILLFCVLLAAS